VAKAGSRSFSKQQTRCAQPLRRGGRWKVVFATVDTQQESLKVYDAVRAAGYSAGIRSHATQGIRCELRAA